MSTNEIEKSHPVMSQSSESTLNPPTPALTDTSVDTFCTPLLEPEMIDLDILFQEATDLPFFGDLEIACDVTQLCNRLQQQESLMISVLNDLHLQREQLKQQQQALEQQQSALELIQGHNTQFLKRKRRKCKVEDWQTMSANFLSFLRGHKRIPKRESEPELNQWFDSALKEQHENKLTVDQAKSLMYICGMVEGLQTIQDWMNDTYRNTAILIPVKTEESKDTGWQAKTEMSFVV